MSTRWKQWRTKRRLAGLLEAEEQPLVIERLALGGWWVTSPAALYVIPAHGDPSRLPFGQVESTRVVPGKNSVMVFVTTTTGTVTVGDLSPGSPVVLRLEQLGPPSDTLG